MKRIFAVLVLITLSTAFAVAQDAPKVDVFGGYSYFRLDLGQTDFSDSSQNLNGWNAAVTGWMNNYLGFTADFSGTYGTPFEGEGYSVKARNHSFLFGPTIGYHAGKITPFAHALFGADRFTLKGEAAGESESDSQTKFALAFGGGVDYNVSEHLGLRVGQVDWVRTSFADEHQNNFRFSTGIVFKF